MILFPAIDLRGGQVVRLEQGRFDAETVYGTDAVAVAESFWQAASPALHVVDLDGALGGEMKNLRSIQAVLQKLPKLFVQMGGGLRSVEAVERVLAVGVSRVVIGTRACESLPFVGELVQRFGGDKIAIGIDARDGIVSTRGWTVPSQWKATDLAQAVSKEGVQTIIYTDIATDGMLTGPNFPALAELQKAVPQVRLVASGGVASVAHVETLAKVRPALSGVIIGKAIYEGKIRVAEALKACE
jgi:phosphoribosylformimino-5-aminoimidazole carboxamide ribotide isomerase